MNIYRMSLIVVMLFIYNLAFCKSWTLNECIEHALSNNLNILSDAIEAKNVSLEKSSMMFNYVPVLSLSNNFSSSTGRTLDETTYQYNNKSLLYNSSNLSITLPLNNVVRNIFDMKKQNSVQLMTEKGNLIKQVALKQEISATYFEILSIIEDIASITALINIIKIKEEYSQKRVEAKKDAISESLLIKSQRTQLEETLLSLNKELEENIFHLRKLVNTNDADFTIDKPDIQLHQQIDTRHIENELLLNILNMPEAVIAEATIDQAILEKRFLI